VNSSEVVASVLYRVLYLGGADNDEGRNFQCGWFSDRTALRIREDDQSTDLRTLVFGFERRAIRSDPAVAAS
jgi:hypothetical protein